MQLVLIGHGNIIASGLGIVAAPLAAGLADTAGRCPEVAAGAAEVHFKVMGCFPEDLFKLRGRGAEQYHVTG